MDLKNVASFVLQIIIIFSFFWFYNAFLVMLVPRNEFVYYNIARVYILSINRKQDFYTKLKYLVQGLVYYQKFLQQNLTIKIRSMNCLYDKILSSSDSNLLLSLTKSFGDTSNKLLPYQEIIKVLKRENECVIETTSRNTRISLEIIISIIVPIVILVLDKLSQ